MSDHRRPMSDLFTKFGGAARNLPSSMQRAPTAEEMERAKYPEREPGVYDTAKAAYEAYIAGCTPGGVTPWDWTRDGSAHFLAEHCGLPRDAAHRLHEQLLSELWDKRPAPPAPPSGATPPGPHGGAPYPSPTATPTGAPGAAPDPAGAAPGPVRRPLSTEDFEHMNGEESRAVREWVNGRHGDEPGEDENDDDEDYGVADFAQELGRDEGVVRRAVEAYRAERVASVRPDPAHVSDASSSHSCPRLGAPCPTPQTLCATECAYQLRTDPDGVKVLTVPPDAMTADDLVDDDAVERAIARAQLRAEQADALAEHTGAGIVEVDARGQSGAPIPLTAMLPPTHPDYRPAATPPAPERRAAPEPSDSEITQLMSDFDIERDAAIRLWRRANP